MTGRTGWIEGEYGSTKKRYVGGLIVATISYAITGESGYVLHINSRTVKTRFESIDDAKKVADRYIDKKVKEHVRLEALG